MTDVVLVRWPEETERLERLRAAGAPRLLLVGEDLAAPEPVDPLEDWIRLPAAEDDLRVRVSTLASRAGRTAVAPTVDDDGLLRYRGRWVTLSPVERALAAALIDRYNAVVGRDTLVRRAWPGGSPTPNAPAVHMLPPLRRTAPPALRAGPALYDARVARPPALVPRALRFEVSGRLDAHGAELERFDGVVPDLGPVDAVAVCLLHADLDPSHEQAVTAVVRGRGVTD